MLEIIGVGSLALVMNLFPTALNDLDLQQSVESKQVQVELNNEPNKKYLAKGKPHESKYRQEADRDSERHEDDRYEEDTRIEDYPRRSERDADQRRGEIDYSETSERRDRDDYESNDRYRRDRGNYESDSRYEERDRREAEYERERSRKERRGTSIFDLLRTGEY